ncbi:YbaB/EbfC family nucleoid-associated protein [Nocardia paucivorans]|uniref:YbaB/EbfC family nucleoid-associated protein n=1 Tax=Nocardia paucivorans TaxID=114259 RepID=UPI0012F7354D|nr:YbaB/EbfC family nucleoid-associated protein [Nocardia paucivorans]
MPVDDWEHDALRSTNEGLRNQVHRLMDAFEQQQQQIGEVRRQLAELRVSVQSSDGGVEVIVDSAGAVVEVRVTPAAMRGTAEQLSQTITTVAREAVRRAKEQTETMLAPLAEATRDLPDLPDILPGAPSLWETDADLADDDRPR